MNFADTMLGALRGGGEFTADELEALDQELGKIIRLAPGVSKAQIKKAVVQAAGNTVKNLVKKTTMTRERAVILANLHKLPIQAQRDINQGAYREDYFHWKVSKKLNSSGIQVIWDGTTEYTSGANNLVKNNQMEPGYHMVVEALKLGYGFHASTTDPKDIQYFTYDDPGHEILNGEIRFFIGGDLKVKLPISDFFGYETGSTHNEISPRKDSLQLPFQLVWQDFQAIKVEVEIPDGLTLPTGNHFLQVGILGPGVRPA